MPCLKKSSGSQGDNKKTYCSTSVDRTKGEDKSPARDSKSHEFVSAAQHRSIRSTQQRKQWQQPRKEEEEGKEEKGRGKKEKGRKRQRVRGQEGRKKEEERAAEEGGSEHVEKDVTGWTVVARNKRQKKMIPIFVKVNGGKTVPTEVNVMDDEGEDVMRQIPSSEDTYVTMQGRVLKGSEKLKSC